LSFRLPIALVLVLAGLTLALGRPSSAQVSPPQAPPGVPTAPPIPSAPPLPIGPQPSASPSASPTPPTGRRLDAFSVTAKRIAFYSNRYDIGADGDVTVVLGDGTRITGNTFSMDLRLNRFLVAGNVKVAADGQQIDGAAFAEFFDFDRAYFIPIASEPDRWTFASGDYAHPLLGRQMPGDVFYLPDLSGERVFLYAKKAVVDPHQSVRFTPAEINFGLTFVPFPSYFLNFSPNPNFAQNSLEGATIDGPLDFAGGEHALATAHIRYDPTNSIYPSYEQHQVSANHYIVASINPLTRPLKQYNLLVYDQLAPKLQAALFFQETAFQSGFSQPLSATAFASGQLTAGLPHSFLQLTDYAYYNSLLGQPQPGIGGALYYGDPSHNWVGNHPNDLFLNWTGFRNAVGKLPLYLQLRSSFGVAHDEIAPIQSFGGVAYDTIWSKALGFNLSTRPLTVLRDPTGRRRDVYFTGWLDKQRQWFSVPHHVDTTQTALSLTKLIDPQKLAVIVSYRNTNTGDFYGAAQLQAYPPNSVVSPATGQVYPSYQAFVGFGTTRSFIEQLNYTPTPQFTLTLSMRENRDFPEPVPGTLLVAGGIPYFNNYGVSPYQATFDVRFRVNKLLVFDISREYFFNFGGFERWSPTFQFQVLK
jgi:hypothetical protein